MTKPKETALPGLTQEAAVEFLLKVGKDLEESVETNLSKLLASYEVTNLEVIKLIMSIASGTACSIQHAEGFYNPATLEIMKEMFNKSLDIFLELKTKH